MNADAKELTISALKALALAAVLLVAFIYLFKWLGMGEQTETQTPAASASTTTEPSPTTTTRPPRQPDPSIGRPAFTEFSILMSYDDTLRSTMPFSGCGIWNRYRGTDVESSEFVQAFFGLSHFLSTELQPAMAYSEF